MAVGGNVPDEPHARTTRPQRRVTGRHAVRIAGEEPNRDGCSDGRDRVGDSGRDVCNEGAADAAGEQDDELCMLWPGDRHRSKAYLARRRSPK
jgi:hypothetical protein